MTPIALLLALAATLTTSDVTQVPFPMRPVGHSSDALHLQLLPEAVALHEHERLTLTDVPLPDGDPIKVQLERVHVVGPEAVLRIDGEPRPASELTARLTLWSGRVLGEPDSDVFLALTPTGSRGWIRRGDDTVHLLAESDGSSRMLRSSEARALGFDVDWTCGVETPGGTPLPNRADTPGASASGASRHGAPSTSAGTQADLPILECRIAIESDTQYAQNFGFDLAAAEDYLVSIIGAVSNRYREQMGIVLTIVYTGLYSGPDPWTSTDTGGDGFDVIFEFIDAWEGGQAPVPADLFYFFGGTGTLPAIGYFEGAGHPDFAFATGNLMDGSTPLPVQQGPLAWNFIVPAHEIGHVFGADHTHAYCPPIDQCSPGFGACQTQQVCTGNGTLMSYCHLCPGGVSNHTTFFHPEIAAIIRDFATDHTGLQPFDGTFATDLGDALAGTAGTPGLDITYDTATHALHLAYSNAPAAAAATILASPFTLDAPFKGGVLVPAPTLQVPFLTPSSSFLFAGGLPTGLVVAEGIDLYVQTWFVDAGGPQGLSATNAVAAELIFGAPWPAPLWVAHPSNGKEYALSSPGTWNAARAQAQAAGGDLASVGTSTLNDWIVATFAEPSLRSIWLGFSDTALEGSFAWADGQPQTFTGWFGGEPDDGVASGQDYAELMLQAVVLTHEDDEVLSAGHWNDTVGTGWMTNRALMQRPSSP